MYGDVIPEFGGDSRFNSADLAQNGSEMDPDVFRGHPSKPNTCGPCTFQRKPCHHSIDHAGRCERCERILTALLKKKVSYYPDTRLWWSLPKVERLEVPYSCWASESILLQLGYEGVFGPACRVDIYSPLKQQLEPILLNFINEHLCPSYNFATENLSIEETWDFDSALRYICIESILSSIILAPVETRGCDMFTAGKILAAVVESLGESCVSIIRSVLTSAYFAAGIGGQKSEHRTMPSALEIMRVAPSIDRSSLSNIVPLSKLSDALAEKINGERERLELYRCIFCDSGERNWFDHVPNVRNLLKGWRRKEYPPCPSFRIVGEYFQDFADGNSIFKDFFQSDIPSQHTPGRSMTSQSFGPEPEPGYHLYGHPRNLAATFPTLHTRGERSDFKSQFS